MIAVFEKSFYERLVDFYQLETLVTGGKKITHILLEDDEWYDFLNDKSILSKATPTEVLCKETETVRKGYFITIPDPKRINCRITIMKYVEGHRYGT